MDSAIARRLLGVDLETAAKNRKNGTGPQILFFVGNVKLHRLPAGRGGAGMPLESLFLTLTNFAHCVWIDEFRTSLPCWLCHRILYEATYKWKLCLTKECPVDGVHRDDSAPLAMSSSTLYSLADGALECTIFMRGTQWPSAGLTLEQFLGQYERIEVHKRHR